MDRRAVPGGLLSSPVRRARHRRRQRSRLDHRQRRPRGVLRRPAPPSKLPPGEEQQPLRGRNIPCCPGPRARRGDLPVHSNRRGVPVGRGPLGAPGDPVEGYGRSIFAGRRGAAPVRREVAHPSAPGRAVAGDPRGVSGLEVRGAAAAWLLLLGGRGGGAALRRGLGRGGQPAGGAPAGGGALEELDAPGQGCPRRRSDAPLGGGRGGPRGAVDLRAGGGGDRAGALADPGAPELPGGALRRGEDPRDRAAPGAPGGRPPGADLLGL